jgi:ACT domain-containing protein
MEDTTVQKRIDSNKELLIEQLKKTPIVQVACEKVGVGRATYYRWRKEDEEFAKLADEAISEGNFLVNDMAESQLMSAIRDKNLTAIIFWLKHHHASYATRVEVTARLKQDDEQLTPDQEALVMRALKLASVLPSSLPEMTEEKQS